MPPTTFAATEKSAARPETGSQVKTLTWAPFGLSACLTEAEKVFQSADWRPREHQRIFMDEVFGPAKGGLGQIPADLLRCISADTAEAINEFLRKYGSGKIQLQPFQDANSVGFAAVTNIGVEWAVPGKRTQIERESGEHFAAAKLKRGLCFQRAPGAETMVRIACKDGEYYAYLVPIQPDHAESTGDVVSLVRLCRSLGNSAVSMRSEHEGVVFPMIDLEHQPNLSWLLDLELPTPTRPQPMFVRQAVQLIGFKMNHLGARFRDEVAVEMAMRGLAPPPLVIDKPFLFWISKNGLDGMPLFAAVLAEEVWKDPGDDLKF